MPAAMEPSSRVEPPLDKAWTRVAHFSEAGPSTWLQQRAKRRERHERGQEGERSAQEADEEESMDVMDQDHNDEEFSEWEYSEEEELVTLDLGPDTQRIVSISDEYAITGLETHTPFLQLGSLVFKGRWDKLLGTEILLRQEEVQARDQGHDEQQGPEEGGNVQQQRRQMDVQGNRTRSLRVRPLEATSTDRKRHTAPSTTRHRIQFAQASNLAEQEKKLSERIRGGQASSTMPAIGAISADQLPRATINDAYLRKTGLVQRKGHVWVRGRGWVPKEKTAWLRDEIYGLKEGQGGITQAEPSARATSASNDDAEAAQNEQADAGQGDQAQATASAAAEPEKPKRGRKPQSDREKVNRPIWLALKKIQDMRMAGEEQQSDRDGGGDGHDGEDEEGIEGDVENQ